MVGNPDIFILAKFEVVNTSSGGVDGGGTIGVGTGTLVSKKPRDRAYFVASDIVPETITDIPAFNRKFCGFPLLSYQETHTGGDITGADIVYVISHN